jgi:sugar phosphate isomerase/epimerase
MKNEMASVGNQGNALFCMAALAGLLVSVGAAGAKDCSQCHKVHLTGDDLSAWRGDTGQWTIAGDTSLDPQNERLLTTKPGPGAIVNGPTGRTRHLLSKQDFGDVRAHLEFMVSKDSNSGVYFMGRYEIQVFDSWQKESDYPGIECGGIYQRWDEDREPKGFEGHSPRINASRAPGQWQTLDVVFRAPRFDGAGRKIADARFEKVVHNDVVVHTDVQLTGPTRAGAYNDERPLGPLMLQGDHGPVAYRNVWLAPAGPNPFFAMDTATKDPNHQTAQEQAEMLKELGYAGIGIGYERWDSLVEMLNELDKRGLTLFAVYAGVNIDPGQPPHVPSLKDAMKVLEGRNTILWLFVQSEKHGPSAPDGDVRAVEIIQGLADRAARHGVRISLYPHHGFWLERTEDAVRIAEKVDRDNVGVTFNLCHWLRVSDGRDAGPLIRAAMPPLSVVTINGADSDGQDWKSLIQTLDRGTFDMPGFLETLRDAGYTGPIGFQGYGIGGDVYDNLKRSMAAWEGHSRCLRGDVTPFGEPKKTP